MTSETPHVSPRQENMVVALAAMVQFVNILDFMMVMPLGPDFARALNISASHIGSIGGSYSFAAAVAGLLASPFLDRFPRKRAMLLCLAGVTLATLATTQAHNLTTMLLARILAGVFGGQMMALSQAMIADFVPASRRGRAMGVAAGGFAVASVIGLPFGLELSNHFGWQAPFFGVGAIGLVVWLVAWRLIPFRRAPGADVPMPAHLARMGRMVSGWPVLVSYAMMGLSMAAGFMIAPNISAHFQYNLGYPREWLGLLYLAGGAVSFFTLRLSGYVVDKYSATHAVCLFSAIILATLMTGFVVLHQPAFNVPMVWVTLIFVGYMVGMSGRNIACNALSSKVPPPHERGLYMSLQSTVTSLASALGAYGSSLILVEQGGKLEHVEALGLIAMGLSVPLPFVVQYVERRYASGRMKAELTAEAL